MAYDIETGDAPVVQQLTLHATDTLHHVLTNATFLASLEPHERRHVGYLQRVALTDGRLDRRVAPAGAIELASRILKSVRGTHMRDNVPATINTYY